MLTPFFSYYLIKYFQIINSSFKPVNVTVFYKVKAIKVILESWICVVQVSTQKLRLITDFFIKYRLNLNKVLKGLFRK